MANLRQFPSDLDQHNHDRTTLATDYHYIYPCMYTCIYHTLKVHCGILASVRAKYCCVITYEFGADE